MRSLSILHASIRLTSRPTLLSLQQPCSRRRTLTTTPPKLAKNRIFPSRVRNGDELHTLLLLSSSSRVPLLTLWTTTWCSTCKTLTPFIRGLLEDDGVGEAQGGVGFVEVEMDSPDLAGIALRYGINAIPTLLAFDREEAQVETIVRRVEELRDREFLVKWIEREAERRGRGGGGGSWRGLFGG